MMMSQNKHDQAPMRDSLQALKKTRTRLALLIGQMEKLLADAERADETSQGQDHAIRRPRFGHEQEQRVSY